MNSLTFKEETAVTLGQLQSIEEEVQRSIMERLMENRNFRLGVRCICIDTDIERLEFETPMYTLNDCDVELENENEVRVFFSGLSDELLLDIYFHQQNLGK